MGNCRPSGYCGGIDNKLIQKRNKIASEDEIVEIMNGCLCCTVRKDLQDVLKRILIKQKYPLDSIIIETTGMADPAPVAQTFFDPRMQGYFDLASYTNALYQR